MKLRNEHTNPHLNLNANVEELIAGSKIIWDKPKDEAWNDLLGKINEKDHENIFHIYMSDQVEFNFGKP